MYHTTPIAIATGDIFRVIDTAIHKLRQFASNSNVHITLVIHPRKDDESQLLTLSSVSLSFCLSFSLSLSLHVFCVHGRGHACTFSWLLLSRLACSNICACLVALAHTLALMSLHT